MNSEALFKALTNIDDALIAEAVAPPKRRVPIWLRMTAAAACIVVMIVGAVLFVPKDSSVTPIVSIATKPEFSELGDMVIPLTPENEAYPIVYPPEEDRVPPAKSKCYIFFSYSISPDIGECVLHPLLSISMNNQENPNTVYWLQILTVSNTAQTPDTIRAEAQRLADLGYEIYMHDTSIYGFFTKEHLEHFCGNTDYGYSFMFATESPDDCERLYAQS